jgi:uncharacterized protein (DUF3084 family)
MKTILPWILVLGLAAGAGVLYFSNSSKDTELAKAREQSQEAETLRTQLEEAKGQIKSHADQIETMRKDNEELLRLRNENRQLRDEKQQLTKQLQTAQAAQTSAQQQVKNLQSTTEQLRFSAELQQRLPAAQRESCINNLRLLDAAKQQWAVQFNKPANAVPTVEEIAVFLPNQKMLVCGAGGQYTLNAVSNAPTCSFPGHVLTEQLPNVFSR